MTAKRINLLPPELHARRKTRTTFTGLVTAGVVLLVVLGAVYVTQEVRLGGVRSTLAAQQDRNADLRAQVAELSSFRNLESEVEAKEKLIEDLTVREVRWSVLLADISLVIPSDVWLTSLTASVNEASADEDAPSAIGQIALDGTTFEHRDVARWLTQLAKVDAFLFPYISLSARTEIDGTRVVNFNSSVELSEGALRRNQRGAARKI